MNLARKLKMVVPGAVFVAVASLSASALAVSWVEKKPAAACFADKDYMGKFYDNSWMLRVAAPGAGSTDGILLCSAPMRQHSTGGNSIPQQVTRIDADIYVGNSSFTATAMACATTWSGSVRSCGTSKASTASGQTYISLTSAAELAAFTATASDLFGYTVVKTTSVAGSADSGVVGVEYFGSY